MSQVMWQPVQNLKQCILGRPWIMVSSMRRPCLIGVGQGSLLGFGVVVDMEHKSGYFEKLASFLSPLNLKKFKDETRCCHNISPITVRPNCNWTWLLHDVCNLTHEFRKKFVCQNFCHFYKTNKLWKLLYYYWWITFNFVHRPIDREYF